MIKLPDCFYFVLAFEISVQGASLVQFEYAHGASGLCIDVIFDAGRMDLTLLVLERRINHDFSYLKLITWIQKISSLVY